MGFIVKNLLWFIVWMLVCIAVFNYEETRKPHPKTGILVHRNHK
jgi:hypothetical protein